MDESVDGTLGDEVAGRAVASARNAAQVLAGYRGCVTSEAAAERVGSLRQSDAGGSGMVAECHRSVSQNRPFASSDSRSEKKSPCCALSTLAYGKLLDDYLAVHRRFRESCAAMPRRDAASWSTELRLRSGRPSWSRNDQRPRSWSPIHSFAATCRIGWQEALAAETERRWLGHEKRHGGPQQATPWRSSLGPRWSPEQISQRLQVDFPNDESMRISHEAIYQALYVQSRGALKRELVTCLRTGRALRVPRSRTQQRRGLTSRPRC